MALAFLALLANGLALSSASRAQSDPDQLALFLGGICAADGHVSAPEPDPANPAGHDHHDHCCLAACSAACSLGPGLAPVGPRLPPRAPVAVLDVRTTALAISAATAPGMPFPARGPPLA